MRTATDAAASLRGMRTALGGPRFEAAARA